MLANNFTDEFQPLLKVRNYILVIGLTSIIIGLGLMFISILNGGVSDFNQMILVSIMPKYVFLVFNIINSLLVLGIGIYSIKFYFSIDSNDSSKAICTLKNTIMLLFFSLLAKLIFSITMWYYVFFANI